MSQSANLNTVVYTSFQTTELFVTKFGMLYHHRMESFSLSLTHTLTHTHTQSSCHSQGHRMWILKNDSVPLIFVAIKFVHSTLDFVHHLPCTLTCEESEVLSTKWRPQGSYSQIRSLKDVCPAYPQNSITVCNLICRYIFNSTIII